MLEINVGRVRELKGAPLAVLALLALAPQPVSKAWLARSSGYSDKPVKAACDYLLEQGLIDCSRSGWRLAEVSQEPPQDDEPDVEDDQYAGIGTRNNSDSQADIKVPQQDERPNYSTELGFSHICNKPQTRNNSDSRGVFMTPNDPGTRNNSADVGFSRNWSKPQTRKNSVSRGVFMSPNGFRTRNNSADAGFSHFWSRPNARKNVDSLASLKILSLKILSLKDLKELKDLKDFKDLTTSSSTRTNQKNRKPAPRKPKPATPAPAPSGKSSQVKTEIWAELSRLGLRQNARTEALVEMQHVTPAYVRALAEKLEQQGRGGCRHTGLFVRACEQAEVIQPLADPRQRGQAVQDAVDRFLNRAC